MLYIPFYHYLIDATSAKVTNLSAKWTDESFTALQVNWAPVTANKGVMYWVTYSHFATAADAITGHVASGHLMKATTSSNVILKELNPNSFYSISVSYESIGAGAGAITSMFYTKCSNNMEANVHN